MSDTDEGAKKSDINDPLLYHGRDGRLLPYFVDEGAKMDFVDDQKCILTEFTPKMKMLFPDGLNFWGDGTPAHRGKSVRQ